MTKHVAVDTYALNLFIEHSVEHWWEQNIFCSFTTPQAFWKSSAPGALSTLVTSVVLYSLTRATLMSPEKDERRVCGFICREEREEGVYMQNEHGWKGGGQKIRGFEWTYFLSDPKVFSLQLRSMICKSSI